MGDYLKLFNTHAEYEAFIQTDDFVLPNVSYCEDNNEVHYNPWTDPRVVAKFNVEDETEPVMLYDADDVIGTDLFSKIEIDGEEINISDLEGGGYYTFETTGEHTVKYTLLNSEVIGESAFTGCSSLRSITIPSSVTSIGIDAFSGCESLTSITIPSGVTSIGGWAFGYCSGLTSINIPSGVTSIGEGAFAACSGLTSIRVESGNTVYDSRNNCNAIIETATNALICGCKNTIIPSSVTSIGSSAFNGCSGLTSINIPNSVTSIGDSALRGCSGLTSITIPNSVTSIGDSAFGYCSGLTSINIPSGVTSIGYGALRGCSGLTSITIPNSVTSIGDYAFHNCSSLTSITIPSSVTSIGTYAFWYCSGLTSITSQATTAPTIQSDTFIGVKTGGTLYVPAGSNYSTWMGNSNYYLGKYGWTMQTT